MVDLTMPRQFTEEEFSDFIEKIGKVSEQLKTQPENLVLDLTSTEYISPLGVLLIARLSDSLIGHNVRCSVRHRNVSKNPLRWFLDIMGLTSSNSEYKDIADYLDSFRVEIHRCNNPKESLNAVNKLMSIIKKLDIPESIRKALNWALWEIVDNAGIHGYKAYDSESGKYSNPVYFCAFVFERTIEIAILDSGQGIKASLADSKNEKYKNITNRNALELAIRDNVSGHPKGSPGFGLFGCSEIARKGNGRLTLISGDNILKVGKNGMSNETCALVEGTMVSMRLDKYINIELKDILGINSLTVIEGIDDLIGDFDE